MDEITGMKDKTAGAPGGKGLGGAIMGGPGPKPAGPPMDGPGPKLAGHPTGGTPMGGPGPMGMKPPMAEDADFIETFEKDGEARNFVSIKTDPDGNFVAQLSEDELEAYAMDVLDGGDDIDNLQVGEPFRGEDAKDKAEEEADRLTAQFGPKDDASDEDLAAAAVKAQGAQLEADMEILGEESALADAEAAAVDKYNEENIKLGEALDEDEPILKQMKKAGEKA